MKSRLAIQIGLLLASLAHLFAAPAEVALAPDGLEFFEKKIRPVLVEHCYSCHSAEAKKIKAGFRLDTREMLLKGGESGPAIIPGDPDKSLLIRAVRYAEKEFQMPPKDKLPPDKIADLAQWVKLGAPDPRAQATPVVTNKPAGINVAEGRKFWAFQPVPDTSAPKVKNRKWAQTPVDQFILADLEAKGFKPAPPAEKRVLIRRATFDLIGLPPTPQEVAEFVADESPDAYARLIDRLLASPHYGERWGRHWLDVARYTDSNGLDENIAYASAFRYRDYVVRAFNEDKPYDRFLQEQLAGDLLSVENETEALRHERQIATGFLSLGPKMLAEDDPQKMEMDIIDEQVDTLGKAFMGLTLGCARCHDHKFDPIPTTDYYSLAAIFKSTKTMENFKVVAVWHEYTLATAVELARKAGIEKRIAQTDTDLKERARVAQQEFLEAERKRAGDYLLAASTVVSFGHPPGAQPTLRTTELVTETRPNAMTPAQLAKDRGLNEEMLGQWISYLRSAAAGPESIWSPWKRLQITNANPVSPAIEALLAGADARLPQSLAVRYQELFARADAAWRTLAAGGEGKNAKKLADEALDMFRVVLHDVQGPCRLPGKPEQFYSAVAKADLKALESQKAELVKQRPEFPTAVGVREGSVTNLKVHLRGNYLTQGDEVPRRFLQVLAGDQQSPLPAGQSGRLQLAQWLTRPDHPLTARVMVNRLWRWHFGTGLVRTPDNFGRLGERPTNPALLDWLAREFVRRHWSIKAMHRVLMQSATYQAGASGDPRLEAADPENKLYGRMPRRRMEAEEVRDAIIAMSGRLEPTLGGQLMTYKNREYVSRGTNPNADSNRRSLYLPVFRSALYEVFQAFDFADPNVPNGERATTTVTPQALFMMNGDVVARSAGWMADNLLAQSALDDSGRIHLAYAQAFGRAATVAETQRMLQFIAKTEAALRDEKLKPEEARRKSWRSLCRVLLASNEFIYIE